MNTARATLRYARARFLAGIALGLVIMTLGGVLSLRSISQMDADADAVTHTVRLVKSTQEVQILQLEIEAASRGYLLTGDRTQFRRHVEARDAMAAELGQVRELIAENPDQQVRWQAIETTIAERVDHSAESVRLHDADAAAALALITSRAGMMITERLARQMDDFQTAEQALLAGRQAVSRHSLWRSLTVTGVTAVGGLGLVVFAGWLILREGRRSREAEGAAAEAASQRAAATYARSLLEASLDPLVTISAEGKITDVNEASVQATGVAREKLVGTDFSDYFTEPEKARAGYRQVFSQGFVRDYPLAIRHVSGRVIDVLYTASVYKDDQGRVLGVFAAARDVTERKRTEAALGRQAGLLDLSSDAIMVRDLNGVISSWNQGAETLYGFSKAEAVGRTALELLDTRFPRPLVELEAELRAAGSWSGELVHRRKDGRLVTVITRWVLEITADTTLAQVLESHTDITVRKAAEGALLEGRQAAEEANRAKSQFLANMSHELRTPLNAIIGFSEILEDRNFGELNPKQDRYVTNILTSGRHLLQLINDILDLSKVESGKLELNTEDFSPARAVEDVLAIIKALSSKKSITLADECAPDLPALHADQSKFKQVLYNLLSNAVKFTPERGRVTVTAEVSGRNSSVIGGQTPVGGTLTTPVLRVSVSDSGIGIKPEDHARVWKEFEQVDSTYARTQQGTGLGLSLTKKLVELHGGRIWLESEGIDGLGSTFIFELPLTPVTTDPRAIALRFQPPAPASETPAAHSGPARPLVLVVDDNEHARALLETYLGAGGYDVAHAGTAAEALKLAGELKPFAITLDILLPDRPGWEVLRELKASPQTRDIPVVIVSITDDKQLGASLGAVDFLVKPIRREALLAVIQRTGSRRQQAVKTVLIVDDEPQSVEALAESIRAEGYTVLEARSGAQGIELAVTSRPDLLILDLLMPEMNGYEVVARLRANPLTAKLPILIYTGADLSAEERAKLQRQVQGIAAKPAREQLLADLARIAQPQRAETSK